MIDMGILIVEHKCYHCHGVTRQAIPPTFQDPTYWMAAAKELKHLKKEIRRLQDDFHELAQECLDAGVKPASMKRCESAMALFKQLKKQYGIEDKSKDGS